MGKRTTNGKPPVDQTLYLGSGKKREGGWLPLKVITSPCPGSAQLLLLAGIWVLRALSAGAQGGGQGGAGGGAAGAQSAGDWHGGQVGQAAGGRHGLVTEADRVLVEG